MVRVSSGAQLYRYLGIGRGPPIRDVRNLRHLNDAIGLTMVSIREISRLDVIFCIEPLGFCASVSVATLTLPAIFAIEL